MYSSILIGTCACIYNIYRITAGSLRHKIVVYAHVTKLKRVIISFKDSIIHTTGSPPAILCMLCIFCSGS